MNKFSEEWRAVEAHAKQRIADMRRDLEDPKTDDRTRHGLAFAITELNLLLELPNPGGSGVLVSDPYAGTDPTL